MENSKGQKEHAKMIKISITCESNAVGKQLEVMGKPMENHQVQITWKLRLWKCYTRRLR